MAREFLRKRGMKIVEQNYRTRWGEIDIIARHGATWVFVEVKTRSQEIYGPPIEAVTPDKQRRMRRMAETYCLERRLEDVPARFDVIGIRLSVGEVPQIEWVPNAFGN